MNRMKIKKANIEKDDLIYKYLPANYADAFECFACVNRNITADDLMIAFWTDSPQWVNKLFSLRDSLVKPFGIKAGNGRNKEELEEAIRNNGHYRFMDTVTKSDNETVISANDKHLKLYFSVKIVTIGGGEKRMKVTTIVHFHNWLGRTYFCIIYPFHSLIVRSMLKHSLVKLIQ